MPEIHPTAVVAAGAALGDGCVVGPYCVVGARVVLGARVHLVSHVVVDGITMVGDDTVIYPFSSIGHRPQDLKVHGEDSTLTIGRGNTIREHVTMNPGTEGGGMVTTVGDGGLFMAGSHVAHDCRIGNQVIMANHATLGGHVVIGDNAIIGGLSAVHQFVRIGAHAMIGGMTGVDQDVIPYGMVSGERGTLVGLNLVGLKRRGFEREEIDALRQAYRALFEGEGTIARRAADVGARFPGSTAVGALVGFVAAESSRGLCRPRARDGG